MNRRLNYFLKLYNHFDFQQRGYRSSRSTFDHLVRLKTVVREIFVHRQHCPCVFFGLERAYYTAWRFVTLRELYNLGIRGRMLRTTDSYVSRRTFRVQIGTSLSKLFAQEICLLQGGVLSVTLFLVKMNSLALTMPPSGQYSLCVDHLQISVSS